ncbi:hypothetical protein RUND412_006908 [Rhizina undulata]
MATAQEQMANASNSIPLPEIPVKLRCTICSELARGAVRLPCCEQSICETCRAALPNVCPVCDHSPLSADDCKPNTALRTTVAVFLRTAEKKHLLSLQKEQKEKAKTAEPKLEIKAPESESEAPASATPLPQSSNLATPPPTQEPVVAAQSNDDAEGPQSAQASFHAIRTSCNRLVTNFEQQENLTQPTDTASEQRSASPSDGPQQNGFVEGQQQNSWFNQQGSSQMNQMSNMQAFTGQEFSGPNGWGDYTQMMPGMSWNGYGNMMGYPMNMNQMGMGQVGGGFDGGNYGNMGMGGTGNFTGGQNGNGAANWNGDGWNGQNNMGFNHPAMDSTRNGGYYSTASSSSAVGGYNHQSHGNHQMPVQQYQNHHFQRQQTSYPPRGGRGGGGFAAGGPRPFIADRQHQPVFDDGQFQQQLQGVDEAVAAVISKPGGDEIIGEKIPSIVSGDPDNNIADSNDIPIDSVSTVVAGDGAGGSAVDPTDGSIISPSTDSVVNPDMAQYFTPDDYRGQTIPHHQTPPFYHGFRGVSRGNMRGGFYRGDFGAGSRGAGHFAVPTGPMEADKPVGVGVEGAPTGPKALREGLVGPGRGVPRRGGFMRARGGIAGSSWSRSMSPERDRGRSYSRSQSRSSRRRSRSPDRDRDRDARSRDRSTDKNRDRDRDRERDRDRDRERRNRRSRSRDGSRSRHRRRRTPSENSEHERRSRTPKRTGDDEKDAVTAPGNSTPLMGLETNKEQVENGVEADGSKVGPPSVSGRGGKRSRESSGSRARSKSAGSKSRSRSGDRRHKKSRRHRRRSPSPERRSHHKRSHKHRSKRHRRSSRSRSRSPKREHSEDERSVRDEGEDKKRREERERRHKKRSSRRDESRHRHHRERDRERDKDKDKDKDRERERDRERHGKSRHDRHDKHERKENRHDRNDTAERVPEKNYEKDETHLHESEPLKSSERKSRQSKSERKLSYKYEDEGDLERQAERDREAERWGIK